MYIVNKYSRYGGECVSTYFFHKKENAENCFRAIAKKRALEKEKDEGFSPEERECNTWDEVVEEFLGYGKWDEVVSIIHIDDKDFLDDRWQEECDFVL